MTIFGHLLRVYKFICYFVIVRVKGDVFVEYTLVPCILKEKVPKGAVLPAVIVRVDDPFVGEVRLTEDGLKVAPVALGKVPLMLRVMALEPFIGVKEIGILVLLPRLIVPVDETVRLKLGVIGAGTDTLTEAG